MCRYFLLWLDSYTAQYNSWKSSLQHSYPPPSAARTAATSITLHGSAASETTATAISQSQSQPQRPRTIVKASHSLQYSWHRSRRTFFPSSVPITNSNHHNSQFQFNGKTHSTLLSSAPVPLSIPESTLPSSLSQPQSPSHLRLTLDPLLLDPFVVTETTGISIDVDGDVRREFQQDAEEAFPRIGPVLKIGPWSNHPHPPPEAFDLIKQEVQSRLSKSAGSFIEASICTTG